MEQAKISYHQAYQIVLDEISDCYLVLKDWYRESDGRCPFNNIVQNALCLNTSLDSELIFLILEASKIQRLLAVLYENQLSNYRYEERQEMFEVRKQFIEFTICIDNYQNWVSEIITVSSDNALLKVGRNTNENHIRLMDNTVSRKHCELKVQQSQVFVQDLRSTTGTYLSIKIPLKLQYNMQIMIQDQEFIVADFYYNEQGQKTGILLIFFDGSLQGQYFSFYDSFSIGTDLVLPPNGIPNFECNVVYYKNEFYIIDGINRAYLRLSPEGQLSDAFKLYHHDKIKIGSTIITINYDIKEELID